MPRKKLVRRFEPRYGVSREAVEIEAKYVARELDDHLLLSTAALEEKLSRVRRSWAQADQVLEAAVYALPERERLVIECLAVRDVFHLYELYCTHLGAGSSPTSSGEARPRTGLSPAKPVESTAEKVLPFSEWLFEPRA